MNRRLFWKILINFWLIFVLVFQLIWIVFYFSVDRTERQDADRLNIANKVRIVAQLIHILGEDETRHLLNSLSETDFASITISTAQRTDRTATGNQTRAESADFVEQVLSPEDIWYTVSFYNKNEPVDNSTDGFFNMPLSLILLGVIAGLLFSWLCALNLIRPMKLIKTGFAKVAEGDLSLRLFDSLKGRHDEISDLARDFDKMVEKLDILISDRHVLLHDVSHELRTPLARLQLAIGLAQQNKDNIDNSLERIELEAHRLDRLIGEILEYTRTDSSNRNDEFFDLQELVNTIIDDANYELQEKEIKIFYISPQIKHPVIKGHSETIRSAIENVIRNAIRYTPSGLDILVILTEVDNYLKINVIDHGPGVEENKISSIFEPFVRIQSPRSGKGYGLGLAIARKGILAHHGSIQAHNGESDGLIITIKLPYYI